MPLADSTTIGPLRAVSSMDSCTVRTSVTARDMASSCGCSRRWSSGEERKSWVASMAMGLFRNTGMSGIRPVARSVVIRWIMSWARPTAKTGMSTMPPRLAVRVITSVSTSAGSSSGWSRSP